MDDIVQNMLTSGITLDTIFDLLILIAVAFIVLWIRNIIMSYIYYWRFTGSIEISKDVVVREGTSVGHIDFCLSSVDRQNVILKSVDGCFKKIIPTKDASSREWIIVSQKKQIKKTLSAESDLPSTDKC
jgi:hypothetical protein